MSFPFVFFMFCNESESHHVSSRCRYRQCLPTSPVISTCSGAESAPAVFAPTATSEPVDEAREWREERYARLWARAAEFARRVEAEGTKFKMDDYVFHTPTKEVTDFVTFHPAEPQVCCAQFDARKVARVSVFALCHVGRGGDTHS